MRAIQPLSKSAVAVFHAITDGIKQVGDHRKINNNGEGSSIMAVCVEAVGTTPQGALIVSIAHYYEQNGDLMADPEITFVVGRDDYVFPVSYKQDGLGIDREYVRWEDGKVFWNLKAQNDLAGFCTTWMRNIKDQQFGGKLPKEVAR
jgi:hypothetical protein